MPEDLSTKTTSVTADKAKRELVVERVFDAPRDLVWKAWTEPDRIAQWWGPRDWNTTIRKMDVRVGGVWHYCMTGPDGTESWGLAVYEEIVSPSRLVYKDVFSDAEGAINQDLPQMRIEIDFIEEGSRTRVVSRTQFADVAGLEGVLAMGVVEGVSQTWDRLAEFFAR